MQLVLLPLDVAPIIIRTGLDADLRCRTTCKSCRQFDATRKVEEEKVRFSFVGASATDLALTVTRVDQLEGVAPGEGVAGDAKPGSAEDDEQEKADDVRAAATVVRTFVGRIIVLVFVRCHFVFATTATHSDLEKFSTENQT